MIHDNSPRCTTPPQGIFTTMVSTGSGIKPRRGMLHWTLLIVLLVLSVFAHAQSIFSNNIDGSNPGADNPFTTGQTFNANITVSGIGHGSGVNNTSASNRYNCSSWSQNTLDANDYITWTLTPNSGYKIDFTSLTGNWQRSNTGPSSYTLRSSLDNYASDIATGAITGSGSAVSFNLSLGAATFDAVTSAITFRLYAYAAGGASGTFSINDFVFNGSVIQLPTITASTTSLNAFNTQLGTPSASQTFTVSGSALTTALSVAAPAGFEVRENGTGSFGSSVSFTPSGGTVSTRTIEVRLSGASVGGFSGNVACTATGATTRNVAVTGTVINVNTSVQLSATSATVAENAGSTTITLQITNPSGSVATNIQLALTSGDAARVGNFTTQGLSFPAGSSTAINVPITISDNGHWDAGATVTFTLQNISGGQGATFIGANNTFTLTIQEYLTYSLVLNEVDYTHPGEDAEFIELKNTGATAISLADFKLDLVFDDGGITTPYDALTLPSYVLPAGGYYVVCGNMANVPNCNLQASNPVDFLFGGAAAAIGLRAPGNALIDAVSYEGNVTGYTEGAPAPTDPADQTSVSIARIPDGQDTQHNNTDWHLACLTPGAANTAPGQSCDDGDPNTILDQIQANCTCAGITPPPVDCLGVEGGPALPGTACDDGLATTGNDMWDANCVCAGQTIDCNGVAGGSDLPGSSCDDADPNTENDTWSAACVCAGTPIPFDCLAIPHGIALPGTPCDDADESTGNDMWDVNCVCAGQTIDCNGVAGGADLPGSACDDGNTQTINDTWSASCQCVGTPVDCLGVPNGAAMPGTACNDQDNTTWNDVWGANCVCAGTQVPPGGAAMIEWNFNTASPSLNTAGDLVVSDVSQGNNNGTTALITSTSASSGYAGATGGNNAGAAARTGALDLSNSAYFSFTLSPFATRTVTLTSFSVGMRSTGTGPQAFTLRSSLDNYASDISLFPVTVANNSTWVLNTRSPLSVASALGTPVTFRIYGYNGSGSPASGTANWRIDDLHLNVAIQTPPTDCNGVVGGPALPGTSCDDGDACTINDVLDASCVCAGSFQDSDGDGICDANDNCPALAGQIGDACDDGDACTINDVITNACACAGTLQDSDGDGVCDANDDCPNVAGQIGSACDDGDACTINDVLDASCTCVGTFQDSDGDGVCDANDDCPNVAGQVGSTCDDGDANTTDDVLDANCVCVGTPIGTCNGNAMTLTLSTDADAAQTTWDIVNSGTTTAVCSGGGYANSTTIVLNCCLPDGCYDLRVFDSFGDGINPGGFVLRDGSGNRVLDNANNGNTFTTQSKANVSFCVPLGTDALTAATCDIENASLTTLLQAQPNPAVTAAYSASNSTTGYQFLVQNPNGGYSRRIFFSHAAPTANYPVGTPANLRSTYFNLTNMSSAPTIPSFVLLNVSVRSRVNGVYAAFGPVCRLKIDPTANCQTTQLTTVGTPVYPAASCGATVNMLGGVVYANTVSGANKYQFEFSRPGYLRRIAEPIALVPLSAIQTNPLQCGLTYDVRVRVSFDNGTTYCAFGAVCQMTTTCASRPGREAVADGSNNATTLEMYPNPNREDKLFLKLDRFDVGVSTVSVDIYNAFGERVISRSIGVEGGLMNTVLDLDASMGSGLYLVTITAGDYTTTQRLVIQR